MGVRSNRRISPSLSQMGRRATGRRLGSAVLAPLLFTLLGTHACAWGAEQAIPGPGPVSPSGQLQPTPVPSPPGGGPTEVPIGRLKDYEKEKRKAREAVGHPPGTVQEDPAATPPQSQPGSCEGR